MYFMETKFILIQKKGLAALTTSAITEITSNTAKSGGNIMGNDGGFAVTSRGVCWSTGKNPTVGNNKTSDGEGSGTFISSLINLTPGTRYYLRAYAVNSRDRLTEIRIVSLPVLDRNPRATTDSVSEFTMNTARVGGSVDSDGGAELTERECIGVHPKTRNRPERKK